MAAIGQGPQAARQEWTGRNLHFVGIGGAGMSGLALIANDLGAEVTGCDRAETPYFAELRAGGHRTVGRARRLARASRHGGGRVDRDTG